jgi:hypothetical protein
MVPKSGEGDTRGRNTIPSVPVSIELQAGPTGHSKQDEGHPIQTNWMDKPSDRATIMAQRRKKRTGTGGAGAEQKPQWGP